MVRIDQLVAAFEAHRDPDRAGPMAAYMKDHFPFLGIPTPERRALTRSVLGDWREPAPAELVAFARAAWALAEREYQYAASDLLARHRARLPEPERLALAEELISTKSWWDTVDALATKVVGPRADHATLERWLHSGDLWLERAVIIHQLGAKAGTDEAFLFEACLAHARSPEFFHRKAIGWALREHAKTDPDAVRAFVAAHEDELSPLSRREALRRLG